MKRLSCLRETEDMKKKLSLHQWRNKEYAACLNRAEEISREFKSLLVHFRSVSEFGRRG